MPWDHLLPGAAALLATVFAVSAFGKARDPRGFAASLEPLRPVPAGVLPLATWSVPRRRPPWSRPSGAGRWGPNSWAGSPSPARSPCCACSRW
ncbi:hypothetical protein HFP72_08395 [Nocardiopsis sp. ARC36]